MFFSPTCRHEQGRQILGITATKDKATLQQNRSIVLVSRDVQTLPLKTSFEMSNVCQNIQRLSTRPTSVNVCQDDQRLSRRLHLNCASRSFDLRRLFPRVIFQEVQRLSKRVRSRRFTKRFARHSTSFKTFPFKTIYKTIRKTLEFFHDI